MTVSTALRTLAAALLTTVAACAGPQRAADADAQSGEQHPRPLPIVALAALPLTDAARPPVETTQLANGAVLALTPALAIVRTGEGRIHAVDLATGRDRWSAAVDDDTPSVAVSDALAFVSTFAPSDGARTLVYALRTGHLVATLPVGRGYVSYGTFFAQRRDGLAAYDGTTAQLRWHNAAAGGLLGTRTPARWQSLLFQDFVSSGATIVDELEALDVRTGHVRYLAGYGPRPFGLGKGGLYVDRTWAPLSLEAYHPLTVGTITAEDGTNIREVDYAPDPSLHGNGPGEPDAGVAVTAKEVRVANGFLYFTVDTTEYRYVADVPAAAGDPVTLPDVRIVAALAGDALVVTHAGSVAVAHSSAQHLALAPVGAGPLRGPVLTREDGSRFFVAGDTLYAVDWLGTRARTIGRPACPAVDDVVTAGARIAVRCGSRVLVYAVDPMPVPTPRPYATPTTAMPPPYAVHALGNPIPPRTSFPPQWDVGPLAAGPAGAVVVALHPTGTGLTATQLARLLPSGSFAFIDLPPNAAPIAPRALAIDANGRVWYNDQANPGLIRVDDPHTGVRAYPLSIEEPLVTPMPLDAPLRERSRRPGRVGPIRIAVGPDGTVWYARTHPSPEIGRVDGSRTYPLPDALGAPLVLTSGDDGALWFLTPTVLGRITPDGKRTSTPLPPEVLPDRRRPRAQLAAGPHGTMWIVTGGTIVQMDATHVVHTLRLPDATTQATALASTCDGTLILGEYQHQIAIVGAGGVFELPTDVGWYDQLVRGPDCRIWYLARNATDNDSVGTLTITRR